MYPDHPTQSEYHRRRAERELNKALDAKSPDTAVLHLELARLHHKRRSSDNGQRLATRQELPIFRTDKEA